MEQETHNCMEEVKENLNMIFIQDECCEHIPNKYD